MFYIGYTNDLKSRLARHNAGIVESTRERLPFDLVYYEASRDRKDAIRRERYLKSTYGHRYLKKRLMNDVRRS